MISAYKIKVIYLILLAFYFVRSYSQTNTIDNTYFEIEKLYGGNQIPLNGKLSDYVPSRTISDPFYLSDKYQKGSINIMGVSYTNVDLKYNIYDQTIEVLFTDRQNSSYGILPPTDFISCFTIGSQNFKKYSFDNTPQYYQVVFDDKIQCLYSWEKKSSESNENGTHSMIEYHYAKRKSYLYIGAELKLYRSKGSFVKLFPKEHKATILKYIKNNRIDLKKSNDALIAELVAYCQTFIDE